MSTVQVAIDINAPVEQVWNLVMDPSRLADWVTIHRGVSDVSSNPQAPGATMKQVLSIRGVSFKVRWTLADVAAPHLARWEGRGPARSRARIRYELSGNGDGPTHFEYTNEFQTPGGHLGDVASRMVVGGVSER
jgi:uncharacterized protein YndB with AHSA1/START domain